MAIVLITNNELSVTRGFGLLEPLLARMRARKANQLIPQHLREGKILDVGCGSMPYFLLNTRFGEKFAIEQFKPALELRSINLKVLDLQKNSNLPFEDSFFSIVTMLAVIEHLDQEVLICLLRELHRILIPGGMAIITTPASWSDKLLHFMARIRLVSRQEIDEHKCAYNLTMLENHFNKAGFTMQKIRCGYFEIFLNLWLVAEK